MLQGQHSAILPSFIKLPFVIKILVLSVFDWPFYTGFTVYTNDYIQMTNFIMEGVTTNTDQTAPKSG